MKEKMRMKKKNNCNDQGGNMYMPTLEARNTENTKMKKIMAIGVSLLLVGIFMPSVFGEYDAEIAGTFTPIGTGLSIHVNNTAPAFGNINIGENATVTNINVTNNGTANASVTCIAKDGPETWTLVAGTASPEANDQYCVNWKVTDGEYVDLYIEKTLSTDLPPDGVNYTYYALKVLVSEGNTEITPDEQTMWANLTASEVT